MYIEHNKTFIIGLPRTGTTSICAATLELGFKTAHTAFTELAFAQAEVIADSPVFCDYQRFDKQYPNSRFIYLARDKEKWLPSIKHLLNRMIVNVNCIGGGFNPIIKRTFKETFHPFLSENISDDNFLLACYEKHQAEVKNYFKNRAEDLLIIDISKQGSYQQLLSFLNFAVGDSTDFNAGFKRLNVGGKVTAWKDIKHPLKIASSNKGRVDKLYFTS